MEEINREHHFEIKIVFSSIEELSILMKIIFVYYQVDHYEIKTKSVSRESLGICRFISECIL